MAAEAAADEISGSLGGIDVLVNNAGIGSVGDIAGNDDLEWARVLDVNVISIARLTSGPSAPVVAACQHDLGATAEKPSEPDQHAIRRPGGRRHVPEDRE